MSIPEIIYIHPKEQKRDGIALYYPKDYDGEHAEYRPVVDCDWTKAFDGHYNLSCVAESKERGSSKFVSIWNFKHCPYCGGRIKIVESEN